MLNHNYIGTEHVLLGLIREGEGVAAKSLEGLGISLEGIRSQVEEIIGQGQQSPTGHIPFTPRAKRVLELSLREALQLGHNYIGTEHILLGLIREGEGVGAQVLVKLGAELIRVRQQVIFLLSGYRGKEAAESNSLKELDSEVAEARRKKEQALDNQDFEAAASWRDTEKRLVAQRNELASTITAVEKSVRGAVVTGLTVGAAENTLSFVVPKGTVSDEAFERFKSSLFYRVEDVFSKVAVLYPLQWSGRAIVGIDWSEGTAAQ